MVSRVGQKVFPLKGVNKSTKTTAVLSEVTTFSHRKDDPR